MRNIELADIGEEGAVKDPPVMLAAVMMLLLLLFIALVSIVEADGVPASGSRNVEARGVKGAGEGCDEDVAACASCEEPWSCAAVMVICVGGIEPVPPWPFA